MNSYVAGDAPAAYVTPPVESTITTPSAPLFEQVILESAFTAFLYGYGITAI